MPDFHKVGLDLFVFASVVSLLFIIAKVLAKEFEAAVLVWIRALKRIREEWRKPLTLKRPSQQSEALDDIHRKPEKS